MRTGKTTTRTGILETPAHVGGWPEYKGVATKHSDGDRMPDEWETKHGLDPKAGDAAKDKDGDGYTNLEEYLSGTGPTKAVAYTRAENNVSSPHAAAGGKAK